MGHYCELKVSDISVLDLMFFKKFISLFFIFILKKE